MSGRLVIYDAGSDAGVDFEHGFGGDDVLLNAAPLVKPCIGCFGCWVKTPGACVLRDRASDLPGLMLQADAVVVVSPLVHGGFSRDVKALFDRSIGYMLPYFRTVDGEMHHAMRYDHAFLWDVHFYGPGSAFDRAIAERLVPANAVNLGAFAHVVRFHETLQQAKEAAL